MYALYKCLGFLQVNTTYKDVCVTNVSANGIIYCQLPSRGSARLMKLLEDTEAILKSQVEKQLLCLPLCF